MKHAFGIVAGLLVTLSVLAAEALELTPSQRAETGALSRAMRTDAQALGRSLLEAEAALDRAFAELATDSARP